MGFPYLSIMRPLNCLMASLAVYIGSLVAGLPVFPSDEVIYALVSAFLVCAGGMVINDYFDVEADRINKPKRPIPSGKISKKMALAYSIILFAAGIAASFLVSPYALLVASSASLVLALYAWKMKKIILAGNLSVSFLVALTFIFGATINLNIAPTLSLAVLAFLSNTGREIFKSIDDILGDQSAGVQSLPIKIGVIRARMIASAFIIFAIILSFVPYFTGVFHAREVYLFFIGITDIIFLTAVVLPKYNATFCKFAMILALVSFLASALA